jgi:hypothetical protein
MAWAAASLLRLRFIQPELGDSPRAWLVPEKFFIDLVD